jgi:hypothetical protein
MAEQAKDVGLSFDKATESVKKFAEPFKAVTKYVGDSVDTFNKLSQTGNSFNNDIVGMKVAAANTRMTLDELGTVVTKNGKDFAGLGGSVAKGGQAFTEFSKTFFDSGLTENLRQMGYTSKDLNEVLANQIGFQKSTTDTSVEGQIRTSKAAADLAMEMDLIAKQTGKTRKEQEEQMEKSKNDGQIEAKMRLIGLTQGAEAEKAARENFAKQLAQAQAMGTDQVFKEMFATGTVRSKEASMQMGLLGDAARETANSAKSLSKGNIEASQAAMESAKVGNMANQKNVALLQVAAAGVGDAGGVMKKNIESNDAAYHGLVKTTKAAEAMGVQLNGTADALKLQKQAIMDEQKARHGATAAMIATQARVQDANAAIANKVVKPLNEGDVSKAALKYAQGISQGVKATDDATKTAGEYTKALTNQAKMGGADKAPVGARERMEALGEAAGVGTAVKAIDKTVGGGLQKAGEVIMKGASFVGDALKVYDASKVPQRDSGTLGETGSPFEPKDVIAKIHAGEMVLTPEQAKNFIAGGKSEGLAAAVGEMAKAMPKMDMKSMSKDINTSTSAVAKQAGLKMPDMGQISFGPDGMPKISPKQQANTIPAAVKTAKAEEAQAAQQAQASQPKAEAAAGGGEKPAAAGGKAATLDDVVKSLNSLNNTMNKVLQASSQTANLAERQVKATKAMSGNVYNRT